MWVFFCAGKEVKTIREQLSSQIEPEAQEVIIPLSSLEKLEVPVKELTISQKRNIRRQDYLTKVSERNDVPFFATLAAVFLVPPICILGIAVATGYIDLFPWKWTYHPTLSYFEPRIVGRCMLEFCYLV